MADTAGGSKLFIGPANPVATTSTAYAALTPWVEIKMVESIPEFGDSSATVTFTPLADNRVHKFKGPRDSGDVSIVCANEPQDPGQLAAIAAEKTKSDYAFKVVTADAVDPSDDSIYYFSGKVNSARLTTGAADNVIRRTFMLAITTEVIEVPSDPD